MGQNDTCTASNDYRDVRRMDPTGWTVHPASQIRARGEARPSEARREVEEGRLQNEQSNMSAGDKLAPTNEELVEMAVKIIEEDTSKCRMTLPYIVNSFGRKIRENNNASLSHLFIMPKALNPRSTVLT